MRQLLIYAFLCVFASSGFTEELRGSSKPFVSGDGFRAYCDYRFDETGSTIDLHKFKDGSTIFVKTDFLKKFFSGFHPRIKGRYILVTHNSDFGIPGKFAKYLDDPKLIAWFGQNKEEFTHAKLHPIPIGIANRYWPHGNFQLLQRVKKEIKHLPKSIFMYLNITGQTFPSERIKVQDLFEKCSYCTSSGRVDYYTYLTHLRRSTFVLSPRGNGLDCHRTWEALYLGAIPILRNSSLNPLFDDLPVLLVDNWEEVNYPFLKNQEEKIRLGKYDSKKLYLSYWLKKIDSYRPKNYRH